MKERRKEGRKERRKEGKKSNRNTTLFCHNCRYS
jgi:DNA invertase Pin-like site-specific DNA recombinase